MRRRRFLGLAAAAAAVPASARAQVPGRNYRIGMLMPTAPPADGVNAAAMIPQALGTHGFVAGRNLAVERRYAGGDIARLGALAQELAGAGVDAIVAIGPAAVAAARRATAATPIVFYGNFDPVALGLVASLARPGGNVTGVVIAPDGTLAAKRLELLAEAVPAARRIAFLAPADAAAMTLQVEETRRAATRLGVELPLVTVREGNYERAFAEIVAARAGALFVAGSTFFVRDRAAIIALAARHRLPATYEWREQVDAGGLMAYGSALAGTTARAADFVARVLRGARPAEMAVEQPSSLDLSINLKTARALGLKLPQALLLRAEVVVE
ncbi:MAG: ABC transporter substrate-binding protein [Burkholderiales bacterium]|nr:ABC transporter substrate-binding protein [Burkholderiales bacterium]